MTDTQRERVTLRDRLLSASLYILPHHAISRLVFRLTRLRLPLKNAAIRAFVRHFKVDMSEAESADPGDYPHFNAFFTRALKDGARPVAEGVDVLTSPVDGALGQFGIASRGTLVQAKRHEYTVLELLGGQRALAEPFLNGRYATLYLSPRDYHRVHMPLDGQLKSMVYVPGRLFSVAPWTTRAVPRLFARNERVVTFFEGEHGPFAMVLVGAINVAAIETVWHGLVTPPHRQTIAQYDFDPETVALEKGREMGRFNLGSTVILLTTDRFDWQEGLQAGQTLRLGRALARVADG